MDSFAQDKGQWRASENLATPCIRFTCDLTSCSLAEIHYISYLEYWLTVHRSITLVDFQLDAKIIIYLHIIHLLKSSTCFEYYPAHLQEVYVVIVYMQPLVSYYM